MGTVLNVCTKKLQQLFIEYEFFHQRPDLKWQLWVMKDTPQAWTKCLVDKTKNYITIFIDTSGCFFLKTIFVTFCIKPSAALFSFRSQSNNWMSLDTVGVSGNGDCVLCTSQKVSSAPFKTELTVFIIYCIQFKCKLKCNKEECM